MNEPKHRSPFVLVGRLIMLAAIVMGVAGHFCDTFITIFGGFGILRALGLASPLRSVGVAFACILVFALLRGILRYAEQASNHYIAFKLLALIRDQVFGALRRLTPAKLEGRDRGDLISLITADIEALEVFYAHTIQAAGRVPAGGRGPAGVERKARRQGGPGVPEGPGRHQQLCAGEPARPA